MSKIFGKSCIVTGGGSGIGRSLCEELASSGARAIYVVDINPFAVEVSKNLPALATHPHFRHGFHVADVGQEEDVKKVIYTAWTLFDTVDAYFSNAGILEMGGVDEKEVSNDDWGYVWNVNVMSSIFAARQLLPLWKSNNYRDGIFVITASAVGLLGTIATMPYHVSKHAAVAVADWLAITYEGISVHCICPNVVRTNMIKRSAELMEKVVPEALDDLVEPRDVAVATINAIDDGTFLVLPHPKIEKQFVHKAMNYDQWINSMRKLQKRLDDVNRVNSLHSKL